MKITRLWNKCLKPQKWTTHNAYLIVDEKITLVDTVKAEFSAEMLKRISQIVDPAKIDYVIVNHVEMDHSGSIPAIMTVAPDATTYCSKNGRDGLYLHYTTAARTGILRLLRQVLN